MRFRKFFSGRGEFNQKFIIRSLIVVILLVLVVSEVVPLLWYRLTIIEDAEELVDALVAEYRLYHDQALSIETATEKLKLMGYSDDEIRQCMVLYLPEGSDVKTSLRVTTVKYANTLITKHIKQLERFSRISCTKEREI